MCFPVCSKDVPQIASPRCSLRFEGLKYKTLLTLGLLVI